MVGNNSGYYYVGGGIGIFLLIIILVCLVWALQWPSFNDGGYYYYPPYGACEGAGGGGYWYPYSYSRVPRSSSTDPGASVCAVSIDSRYVERGGRRGGGGGGEGMGGDDMPDVRVPSAVIVGGGSMRSV